MGADGQVAFAVGLNIEMALNPKFQMQTVPSVCTVTNGRMSCRRALQLYDQLRFFEANNFVLR